MMRMRANTRVCTQSGLNVCTQPVEYCLYSARRINLTHVLFFESRERDRNVVQQHARRREERLAAPAINMWLADRALPEPETMLL